MSASGLRIADDDGKVWAEAPLQVDPERVMTVQTVIDANIVEVFFHDRSSLCARLPEKGGPLRLSLTSTKGSAAARELRYAELTPR